jgi:amino acid adenylation domain-containing protein
MWFLWRLDPGTSAYNTSLSLRLRGPLNPGALEGAVQDLVRRHEVLRTRFAADESGLVPFTAPFIPTPIPVEDLSHLPPDVAAPEACGRARDWIAAPYDLATGPVHRMRLFRVGAQEHLLVLAVHHIAFDAWSRQVAQAELQQAYTSRVQGHPDAAPPLRIQYSDFAAWQRAQAAEASSKSGLAYWTRQLAGELPVLRLPMASPPTPPRAYRGARVETLLPAALAEGLERLGREHGATLFMVLMTGLKALLHRYTGQEDIIVGIPVAGRHRVETEGLIGCLINTLAIRDSVRPSQSFLALLQQVRLTMLDALEHQAVPFEQVVQAIHPNRDLNQTPVFQVMLNLRNVPGRAAAWAGLEVERVDLDPVDAPFDLSFDVEQREEGLRLICTWGTEVMPLRDEVVRLVSHYQALLESALSHAGTPLDRLPLVAVAAGPRIAAQGCGPTVKEMWTGRLEAWIEQLARAHPEAPAVVDARRSLTFGELDAEATALAARLRAAGAGRGTWVGIGVERSSAFVVSLLAVLKSGAGFIPLDPGYPADRLAFMLEDARPVALITEPALHDRWPATPAQRILVGGGAGAAPFEKEPRSVAEGDRADPAYLIYTSGSTGRPNGVVVSHAAICGHLGAVIPEYGLRPQDRVLGFASFSFDAALEQVLGTLCAGATLVLRGPELPLVEELSRFLESHRITVADLPPVVWSGLAAYWRDHGARHDLSSLRLVMVGGEEMPPHGLGAWREGPLGRTRLLNAYGPTEAVITATLFDVHAALERGEPLHRIPIGRLLPGRSGVILDPAMNPVPQGLPGELWIGGPLLALGYHNRPELTSHRFREDPFEPGSGRRLYRTGDLCRWRADGHLEFLGRTDDQVKLRGFRIELGEVEACLGSHPAVRECAVAVWGEGGDTRRLVGYYVLHAGRSDEAAGLRTHLRSRLPPHMVPAALVPLHALPLMPSGKVDRAALPPPGEADGVSEPSYEPPRAGAEARMASLWVECLGLPRVGRNEDFFALGGHSMLAPKLFARIEAAFGRKLPLAALFQAPTVARLTTLVAAPHDEVEHLWASLVRIRPQGSRPPFFCVHGGGGEILFGPELAAHLNPEIPFYGLQARGLRETAQRDRSIEAMAAHYLEEIRPVAPTGPLYLGGFCLGGIVAYEMAQRLLQEGREIGLLVLIDSYNPLYARGVRGQASVDNLWRTKVGFHLGNLRRLPFQERVRYVRQRAQVMAAGHGRRAWNALLDCWPGRGIRAARIPDPVQMEQLNSTLSEAYTPQPIRAHVLVVRPEVGYPGLEDPHLGWRDLVKGDLDVAVIPVNPGGLLMRPFIGMVGARLDAGLEKAAVARRRPAG